MPHLYAIPFLIRILTIFLCISQSFFANAQTTPIPPPDVALTTCGDNDILFLYGNCIKTMKLVIYNRWGQIVYEGIDAKEGWNGYFNNKLENTAVFAYYLEHTLLTGESKNQKGNISLVR